MNRLHDTSANFKDEGTTSEEIGDFETALDSDEFELNNKTSVEPFDDDTWGEPETTASEPRR